MINPVPIMLVLFIAPVVKYPLPDTLIVDHYQQGYEHI